jgi:ABC-2 type transport system permease protein
MSNLKIVIEIARWEFFRWFKVKDLIVTIVIFAAMGLFYAGTTTLGKKTSENKVKIVVLKNDMISLSLDTSRRIELLPAAGTTEQSLREALVRREIDGILIVKNLEQAEIIVVKEPTWKTELHQYLTQERRRAKMEAMQISPEQLSDIFSPVSLTVSYHELSAAPTSIADKIAAIALIVLMLIGVFYSVGSQFVAITGEKQLRVTEQIISAVSPQQWVDGKLLGISAFSFIRVVNFAVGMLVSFYISKYFGMEFDIPIEITNVYVLLLVAVMSIGGFLFWNAFFAAIAATINDPNTSSRSALLFVPFIPAFSSAFLALKDPDTALMQVLTIFPLTSPAVLPARLVLTEVPFWEIAAAIVVLGLSAWMLRLAAGKIFHVGMLMYGKEPRLSELIKWIRKS